jgi:cytosine deaminase
MRVNAMTYDNALDLLAFNLKLVGSKTNKNVLVSAGKNSDKLKLLPYIQRLEKHNISLYATPGTRDYYKEHGLACILLNKIVDKIEPNILSFLQEDRFDLVINILTGNHNYDENSDSNLIRTLCIRNGIPIITDVDLAILTIEEILDTDSREQFKYRISDPSAPWDMKREFLQMVSNKGGFSCYHAHFDKAYLISLKNLRLSQVDMQKKWELYKYLKENYKYEDLVERISRAVEIMINQGVTHCRTFVDADSTVGTLPVNAAIDVRKKYKNQIKLEIAIQPLEGILNVEARKRFEEACELADVIGGLPSKDRPTPEKHLDYVLGLARELKKPVDAHVDQENNPDENETELLAVKTMEYGLEGNVRAVHSISLAAKPPREQDSIIGKMKSAGLSVIVCPSAALSMKKKEKIAPLHNSIAPVIKLLEHKIPVYLGVDNIADLFMPLVDGDMWVECRFLMEALRHYDLDAISSIACSKNGFSADFIN